MSQNNMNTFKNRLLLIATLLFSIIILTNIYLINEKNGYLENLTKHEHDFVINIYTILTVSLILIFFILLIFNFFYSKLTFKIEKYINILDKISDNIFVIDLYEKKLIFLNESAKSLLKYNENEIKDLKLENILIPFNNENFIDLKEFDYNQTINKNIIFRAFIKAKDSIQTPVEISFSYVENKNKQYIVAVCFDISKQLILELQDSANKEIIDEHVAISQTDLNGEITYVNNAFCNLTGYSESQLLGKKHSIFKHHENNESVYEKLWEDITENKTWKGVLRSKINNQKTIWSEIKIKPRYDYLGQKIGYISTREDISYKKELEYISEHDILTKIKNRRTFEKELEKKITLSSKNSENSFGLIMIDIDHFKLINDTFGHQVGDFVLRELSKNISKNLKDDYFFARWGGEEFMILCPFSDIKQLEELAKNLQLIISSIDFNPLKNLTISIGITNYQVNDSEDTIQIRVDKALYKAKENGRNRYEII